MVELLENTEIHQTQMGLITENNLNSVDSSILEGWLSNNAKSNIGQISFYGKGQFGMEGSIGFNVVNQKKFILEIKDCIFTVSNE